MSAFTNNSTFTEEALNLAGDIAKDIKELIKKYHSQNPNFKSQEIEYIFQGEVTIGFCEFRLFSQEAKRKVSRTHE